MSARSTLSSKPMTAPLFMDEHTYVKSIRSNSDGTGEFTLKMPQSYYDATMAGDKQFVVALVGGSGGSMENVLQ